MTCNGHALSTRQLQVATLALTSTNALPELPPVSITTSVSIQSDLSPALSKMVDATGMLTVEQTSFVINKTRVHARNTIVTPTQVRQSVNTLTTAQTALATLLLTALATDVQTA